MTYAEAIQFLFGLQMFGARPGLERTQQLAERFGNPHEQLRFIHVAGTNGKGSTCAMLECIYRAAGLRVGLFTSPHLISFRERIQINRRLIPKADVARLVAELRGELGGIPLGEHPTMFEVVTVMALRYFFEQQCDLVIWETGLGGRLDATNIVMPLASVITNIALDHQQWLGPTVAAIAAEKAGIIKAGVPVITCPQVPEIMRVLETKAALKEAPFRIAAAEVVAGGETAIGLSGAHQRQNAALAVATVRALRTQVAVDEAAIQTGLQTVNWPGRLQLLDRPQGRRILLDGAHNESGLAALVAAVRERFPDTPATLVLGMLGDKQWREMTAQVASVANRVLAVPVATVRTVPPVELAAACRAAGVNDVLVCGSLTEALDKAEHDTLVIITGSLYLVGEALELLGFGPEETEAERELNEWQPHRPSGR